MFLRFSSSILLAAFLIGSAAADQTRVPDYATARDKIFYRLYVKVPQYEATDVYCGLKFWVDPKVADLPESSRTGSPAPWLTLEHAYPAKWMATALGCGNRETCPKDNNATTRDRFNHAEGDMHNLWPAVRNLNSSRQDSPFGEIPGSEKRKIKPMGSDKTFECDYQRKDGIVEPRRIVRGNLARSIFYMCQEYGFPVDPAMFTVLKKWNMQDKPTQGERRRNDKIEQLQGTRNAFIDDPALADNLQCATP